MGDDDLTERAEMDNFLLIFKFVEEEEEEFPGLCCQIFPLHMGPVISKHTNRESRSHKV